MSATERWEKAETMRSLEQLTRAELAARVRTLRLALDDLGIQAVYDGGPAFSCRGAMLRTLMEYETRMRQLEYPSTTVIALSQETAR